MTGIEDPVATYYMACGWHRGYFGMQVNSATERRIIFSVWDSGGEAVSRSKVADTNRVMLMGKGAGVNSGDFGNEGTGGHSHLVFPWKTGEKQRFIVTAKPVDATHTIYAGYYFRPDQQEWMLISSWKAPKEGGYLRGLYSFSGKNSADPANSFDNVNAYGLLNLYVGLRDPEGAWEVTVFGKNVLRERKVLSTSNNPLTTTVRTPFGTSNPASPYVGITSITAPREFGITARIALGSR
jgi:hypothetical protein